MYKYFFCFLLFSFLFEGANAQQKWKGTASYYHSKFNGRKTSNGDKFDQTKFTAANNFLPLGTKVKLTNIKKKQSVIVVINDRMHARNKRLIDVSKAAAIALGFVDSGLCQVEMELIPGKTKRKKKVRH